MHAMACAEYARAIITSSTPVFASESACVRVWDVCVGVCVGVLLLCLLRCSRLCSKGLSTW